MNARVQTESDHSRIFGLGRERVYFGIISDELAEWYLYQPDCGHSILCLCLLEGHIDTIPTFQDLCPVPVKTVLRGYCFEIIEDIPVPVAQTGFTYDDTFWLRILETEDEEF